MRDSFAPRVRRAGLPLGVVVTPANVNDGYQTQSLLTALVAPPPAPTRSLRKLNVRGLPTAQADGAYGNLPSQARFPNFR